MRKSIFLLSLLLLTTIHINSQNDISQKPRFIDNVRFGGSINMGFGKSHSTFAISPSAIYDFSSEFSAGLSLTYIYLKNKSTYKSTTNIFGGSVLALFRPIQSFQLSAEFEQLKLNEDIVYDTENDISTWQPALYLGAEYVMGNIAVGFHYDVLFVKATNVIYATAFTPVVRVYF